MTIDSDARNLRELSDLMDSLAQKGKTATIRLKSEVYDAIYQEYAGDENFGEQFVEALSAGKKWGIRSRNPANAKVFIIERAI